MTRQQLRHRAACDRYQAEKKRPPTRKQAEAWLAPIRRAFNEMLTGELDVHRGYAITRIHWADEDFARVDHCINGFVAMLTRLAPAFDVSQMTKVSKKLENGVLLECSEVEACFATLAACEDLLITFPREALIDAAKVEQISIEMERLNLKELN